MGKPVLAARGSSCRYSRGFLYITAGTLTGLYTLRVSLTAPFLIAVAAGQ